MKLGYETIDFAANHSIKGCHAFKTGMYRGSAFYGLGGDEKQISTPYGRDSVTYRPYGYDCTRSGNLLGVSSFSKSYPYYRI